LNINSFLSEENHAKKIRFRKAIENRELITRDQIESEITAMWGFNPYRIFFDAPLLRRVENFVRWGCLNCGHQFAINFAGLEEMRKEKGYYCLKCHGTGKPVDESKYFDSKVEMLGETSKWENTAMTVKDIFDLAEHGRLAGYPNEENVKWNKQERKDFEKFLLDGNGFALSFRFILMPDDKYEIFDGKQRISLLFHLLEKCGRQESERIENMECRVKY
jgi:hypothetical protein